MFYLLIIFLHYGFSNILLWNFSHTAKLKEFYSEHLYTYPLDSTINLLPYLLYHMFIRFMVFYTLDV